MIEFFYLDREGRELGSIWAESFKEAHAWLGHAGMAYHEITRYKPKPRKRRRGIGHRRQSVQLAMAW